MIHATKEAGMVSPTLATPGIAHLTVPQLLALHARIADELRGRGITRSSNNPIGDVAEYLFCKAFGWKQTGNSNRHFDAVDSDSTRYQIKGRRMTRYNHSCQLGALRDLAGAHFDFLGGILFSEDYGIVRAEVIPCAVVVEHATFVARTNSHRFLLRDEIWDAAGVRDVTAELRSVSL